MVDVQVHVVHPNERKWITESRGKTDRGRPMKLAELARAGLWPRAVPVVTGPGRARREVVSARQQVQRMRVALGTTIRGDVGPAGYRVPEQFCAGPTWRAKPAPAPTARPAEPQRSPKKCADQRPKGDC
ncbi:MAG: hypothetical protein KatS3mg082_2142 [Nitrospiraceae bacterium]|nr:MAG: hypothetical protein KatS3mg082_2142 [Nitrospiraceae bacterium]